MAPAGVKVGVLGLQGAVREHVNSLLACSAEPLVVKNVADLQQVAGLIIPGGESTAIRKLIDKADLLPALNHFNKLGKPIFGTCAGLILLASRLSVQEGHQLGFMNITVQRNSFGRQVDSFETDLHIEGLADPFNAVFIRAPHIVEAGEGVEILATYQNRIVMVRQGHLLGCSFHPELTDDARITELFLQMVKDRVAG